MLTHRPNWSPITLMAQSDIGEEWARLKYAVYIYQPNDEIWLDKSQLGSSMTFMKEMNIPSVISSAV